VVRIPFTKDYVPVSFAMSQNASQSLCRQVQAAGGACDVVSPATFASFADLAAREKGKGAKPSQTRQAGSHFEFFHQFHAPPVQFEPHGTRASLEPLSATADTQTG
jgi:hypothetical protein